MTDTPETDAVLNQFEHHLPNWLAREIMAAVARRLERERNEARFDLAFRRDLYKLQEERVKELEAEVKLWKENATSNKDVFNFVERERDEAVNACHIWQRGHSKLVADRDDWKKEAERWCVCAEQLTARAVNHLQKQP
jgi:hypothetical protein